MLIVRCDKCGIEMGKYDPSLNRIYDAACVIHIKIDNSGHHYTCDPCWSASGLEVKV